MRWRERGWTRGILLPPPACVSQWAETLKGGKGCCFVTNLSQCTLSDWPVATTATHSRIALLHPEGRGGPTPWQDRSFPGMLHPPISGGGGFPEPLPRSAGPQQWAPSPLFTLSYSAEEPSTSVV